MGAGLDPSSGHIRPRTYRPGGTRTPNRRFWRPVLYQLSYGPLKWPGAESNRRHHDFQSCALPTELPGPKQNPPGHCRLGRAWNADIPLDVRTPDPPSAETRPEVGNPPGGDRNGNRSGSTGRRAAEGSSPGVSLQAGEDPDQPDRPSNVRTPPMGGAHDPSRFIAGAGFEPATFGL